MAVKSRQNCNSRSGAHTAARMDIERSRRERASNTHAQSAPHRPVFCITWLQPPFQGCMSSPRGRARGLVVCPTVCWAILSQTLVDAFAPQWLRESFEGPLRSVFVARTRSFTKQTCLCPVHRIGHKRVKNLRTVRAFYAQTPRVLMRRGRWLIVM